MLGSVQCLCSCEFISPLISIGWGILDCILNLFNVMLRDCGSLQHPWRMLMFYYVSYPSVDLLVVKPWVLWAVILVFFGIQTFSGLRISVLPVLHLVAHLGPGRWFVPWWMCLLYWIGSRPGCTVRGWGWAQVFINTFLALFSWVPPALWSLQCCLVPGNTSLGSSE